MKRLMQLLWLQLPLRVARIWPSLGVALADGHFLVRWPPIATYATGTTALFGYLLAALQTDSTFTFSLLTMVLLGAVAQVGASLGLSATIGYIVGDMFSNLPLRIRGPETVFTVVVPSLLSYALLGLLTVVLPLVVLGARTRANAIEWVPRQLRTIWNLAAAGFTAALGASIWSGSIPMLIRPVFIWPGGTPSVEAVAPLQTHGWVLVCIVALCATARALLECRAVVGTTAFFSRILWTGLTFELSRQRPTESASGVRLVVYAAGLTFFLSGMIASVVEAVIAWLLFVGLLFFHHLLRTSKKRLVATLRKTPFGLRLVVGGVCAWGVARSVLEFFWNRTTSLMPVLVSACVAAAVLAILLLPQRAEPVGRKTGASA